MQNCLKLDVNGTETVTVLLFAVTHCSKQHILITVIHMLQC